MKVIIVGAGEVGYHIASRLALENKDVVVVEKDQDAIKRITDTIDVQVVVGSGSSPVTLNEAGIREAEILLAVTDSDETNLVACLVADAISPHTKKLARLRDAGYDDYHETFRDNVPHIDTVINPEIEVVKTIDQLVSAPGAVDIGEFAEGRVKFVGIRLDENARLAGVRLINLPEYLGDRKILIAAIIREEKLIIPRGDDVLLPNDLIYFMSEKGAVKEALSIFDKKEKPVKRALIIGGGRIGLRLARHWEDRNIHLKIIEHCPKRSQELADILNKAVVFCGDGSDQALLQEEHIEDMDVVVTLTNDEETNILSSLLAKRMGAKKTITRISKFSYFPLMTMIGIEQVVDPRLSAIDTILRHIRRGKVISAMSIRGEEAEVMEAMALETSDIVGKPLERIQFPKGGLVAGIIRGDIFIMPSGKSVIQPEDRILIFARREAIPKIEKILSVKLEFF